MTATATAPPKRSKDKAKPDVFAGLMRTRQRRQHTYGRLVRKLVDTGKLSAGDDRELTEVMTALAISDADLQSDISAAESVVAYERMLADANGHRVKAEQRVIEAQAERDDMLAEARQRAKADHVAVYAADKLLNDARQGLYGFERAESSLERARAERPHLFAAPAEDGQG